MKKLLFLFALCLISLPVFTQESSVEEQTPAIEEEVNIKGSEYQSAETFLDFIHSLDFVLQFEPGMYMNFHKTNSEGKLISAPSPLIYPVTIGILWPNYTFIAVQPSISFFTMQYLYYDGMALPAEIENRTASSLSFMVNIPVVFTLFMRNSRLQLSGGLGILLQFGLRSTNVGKDDYGYSGSAESDVELINKYFWNNMHWLYLTTSASWLYNVTSQLRFGPTASINIPIGALMGDQDMQGLMLSVGLKICR